MQIQEFYSSFGADYSAVLHRLADNEGLVRKYLGKFIDDPTYGRLQDAVAAGDMEAVLQQAHTLKGISANLELTSLVAPCADMVAQIRAGQTESIPALFTVVQNAYNTIIEKLKTLL